MTKTTIYCDRCGKALEKGDKKYRLSEDFCLMVRNIDLCEKCKNEFNRFLRQDAETEAKKC